jgi:hypothetical protein
LKTQQPVYIERQLAAFAQGVSAEQHQRANAHDCGAA